MTIANVYEGSSHPIIMTFVDSVTREPITLTSVTWTLKNGPDGAIVNGRENVEVTPSSTIEIVLEPEDTQFEDGKNRVLFIDGVYDSSDFGTGMTLTYWEKFTVRKLGS